MRALLLEGIHSAAVTLLEARGLEVEIRAGALSETEQDAPKTRTTGGPIRRRS
jgi:hypothetical protein